MLTTLLKIAFQFTNAKLFKNTLIIVPSLENRKCVISENLLNFELSQSKGYISRPILFYNPLRTNCSQTSQLMHFCTLCYYSATILISTLFQHILPQRFRQVRILRTSIFAVNWGITLSNNLWSNLFALKRHLCL